MKGILSFVFLLTASSGAAFPRAAGDSSSSVSASASATASADSGNYFMDDIYKNASASAKGFAPYADNPKSYVTYANIVRDFQAPTDGTSDATAAIQNAIDSGSRSGTSKSPRQVFVPAGTYVISKTINLKMGTILVGDPVNLPTLKASSGFSADTLVNGYDSSSGHAEDSFFTAVKNVVIDTTGASGSVVALQWGVAQACGTSNVHINMPTGSQHTGINLNGGSTVAVSDVNITGGAVGISNSNQQVNFKGIAFNQCSTGYQATGGWTALLQSPVFNGCDVGADITGGSTANLAIVDGAATAIGTTVLKFTDSSNTGGSRNNQVYIENLTTDSSNPVAQTSSGKTALAAASRVDAWAWGNVTPGQYEAGSTNLTSSPPAALQVGGKFATPMQPTFAQSGASTFVNVKADPANPVQGDGKTDDSASLNTILASAAKNNQNVFFPYGVYIVQNTLLVPEGTRMIGEAWATISGAGSKFQDATNPTPVVQIGNAGDVGVAQIQDMRFTVNEVLPGAIIVQWNVAGNSPGDVGMWNSVVNIGGAADSSVTTSCSNQDTSKCMAAFLGMHMAATSSAYVENLWVWTADHAFDGTGGSQIISTHGGVLVESSKATWLMGVGSEHHWLYNVNFSNASNVYAGLLQTETPYMQGEGATLTVPAPWTADEQFGDPDYSWCDATDQKCRTALAVNVAGGSDVYIYNTASWAFFNGPWDGKYDNPCQGTCQTNMNRVSNVTSLHWAQVNTKSADVLVLDGQSNPNQNNHPGSWGGIVDAYEQYA